jgi:hypothetical protein
MKTSNQMLRPHFKCQPSQSSHLLLMLSSTQSEMELVQMIQNPYLATQVAAEVSLTASDPALLPLLQ